MTTKQPRIRLNFRATPPGRGPGLLEPRLTVLPWSGGKSYPRVQPGYNQTRPTPPRRIGYNQRYNQAARPEPANHQHKSTTPTKDLNFKAFVGVVVQRGRRDSNPQSPDRQCGPPSLANPCKTRHLRRKVSTTTQVASDQRVASCGSDIVPCCATWRHL